jgi:EAL domain-containing protein (putative c-di-GMP-specific phosphodiesterase class I)
MTQRDGSIVQPADFIPVAENSGSVGPLGAQILRLACTEARRWQVADLGRGALSVGVNLSPRQLELGDMVATVQDALDTSGLRASLLHFELVETAVMDLRPDLLGQLHGIRDLGVEIGLDDFGTGHASLTNLRSLPLNFVKIDKSFVNGLGTNRDDEGIVSAVIEMAAHLGLRSIAEGVETEVQLQCLREMGCNQAQGYHLARPMSPDRIQSLFLQ